MIYTKIWCKNKCDSHYQSPDKMRGVTWVKLHVFFEYGTKKVKKRTFTECTMEICHYPSKKTFLREDCWWEVFHNRLVRSIFGIDESKDTGSSTSLVMIYFQIQS